MAKKVVKETIHAKGFDISIYTTDFENEFLSLTDIARYKSDMPHDVVKNWMRSRETLEFLGLWEKLHNPDFKQVEFDLFRREAGLNAFTMSPTKWIEGVKGHRPCYKSRTIWWNLCTFRYRIGICLMDICRV